MMSEVAPALALGLYLAGLVTAFGENRVADHGESPGGDQLGAFGGVDTHPPGGAHAGLGG